MIFKHPQINKTTEVLNDLSKVNDDRISCYQSALKHSATLEAELQDTFQMIISEGMRYRQQLKMMARQIEGDIVGNDTNIIGKIYIVWSDLKGLFSGNTQKAIIASCLYHEEIALHVYNAAQSLNNGGMTEEIHLLLNEQKRGLKENYTNLRNYHNPQTVGATPMYLT